MLVKAAFLGTEHGKAGCVSCHGGVEPAKTRAEAHKGLVARPSAAADAKCATCHEKETKAFAASLHFTSAGIVDLDSGIIAPRIDRSRLELVKQGVETHCASCHISACGDCHVSRPRSSGGGFVDGHNFYKSPNSVLNCTACHGSRVEKEMMAKGPENLGLQPDVHWAPKGIQCVQCHTNDWIHGGTTEHNARYEVAAAPRCESCHPATERLTGITAHQQHASPNSGKTTLQCQVCHSQAYNTCYGCHVGKDSKGLAYFKTDRSEFNFKIGRNPDKSADRPYDYVLLRHVPVARDTFGFYGEGLLSNFDALPTWKYATPHNILRVTPQSQGCASCHNNPSLFLRAGDVLPDEREANKPVIVDRMPPKF